MLPANEGAALSGGPFARASFAAALHRRPGAGVGRLFTPGRKVGGLFEKAAAAARSVVAIANFKKVAACSVRYFLPGTTGSPSLPVAPGAFTHCGEIRSGGSVKSGCRVGVRRYVQAGSARRAVKADERPVPEAGTAARGVSPCPEACRFACG